MDRSRPGLAGYFNLIGNLMAGHGKAQRDSNYYGFYAVRLKESMRKEAPRDTTLADSLIKHDKEENDDYAAPVVVEPVKKTVIFAAHIRQKRFRF